ncbi:MAG: N-acetylmuramoyl-L-alanine amidase [Betaproteobacteria bacterium]|nr:N-acetylmuramoyl-L-alanine amidase [Betaproteobacteria bacterium]
MTCTVPLTWQPARLAAPVLSALLALLPAAAAAAAAQTAAATTFTLDLLSPKDQPTTTRDFVNVLGRTLPGAGVRVAGEPVPVYATGVFARDRIPLVQGLNRIVVEATSASGHTLTQQLDIERIMPPAPVVWPVDRLALDGASLRPAEAVTVAPGEAIEVAVRATPGQHVEARLPGQRWQPVPEQGAASGSSGRYRALLHFEGTDDVEPAPVQLRLVAQALPRGAGPRQILTQTPGAAGQWRRNPERLYVAGPDGAALLHGLHEVRLGGPFLAELPPGTLLHATGRRGGHLRVQLSPDTSAWVAEASLLAAAPDTRPPHAAFTTVSAIGNAEGDVVSMPLAARVPYAVNALTTPEGRQYLEVDLYGAHHAATWVSQRAGAKLVRELHVEQAGPGRVRVRITPLAPRLWGWRVERTAGVLRVLLRPAPLLDPTAPSPLDGLRVALEAGHGGLDNLGAVGATGVPEKDINRWTADALKAELEAAGAQVVMVREGDDNPDLRERARRVDTSGAELFVSIHANASDTTGGFLRVAGASTFYKHAPHRELAAAVQRRVLEQTGLDDFGVVGNFNYTPLRLTTWMPAVLVEQAFVSHPADEARLLDPQFRARLARAVRMGLEDHLRSSR